MSGFCSIASHCRLQNLPEIVRQEQTGCAHFSAFTVVNCFLLDSVQQRLVVLAQPPCKQRLVGSAHPAAVSGARQNRVFFFTNVGD